MKKYPAIALFSCLAVLGFGAETAAVPAPEKSNPVTVVYSHPDKFTDFRQDRFADDSGQAELMKVLNEHLNQLGRKLLAPGERLEITFNDIDLAGSFEPWHGAQFDDIRIMKDIYSPRMELTFRLVDTEGKIVSEGKRELRDLNYLMNHLLPSSDGLRYDKQLLADWMRREFRRK